MLGVPGWYVQWLAVEPEPGEGPCTRPQPGTVWCLPAPVAAALVARGLVRRLRGPPPRPASGWTVAVPLGAHADPVPEEWP